MWIRRRRYNIYIGHVHCINVGTGTGEVCAEGLNGNKAASGYCVSSVNRS